MSTKAACPPCLSIHIYQGLALNPKQSKTQINTQCEIVIITVKTCVVFQYFKTNQVLSCFWIWQAKILHGSRKVFFFFFVCFPNVKVNNLRQFRFFFFWICTMSGVTKTHFPIMLCCSGTQLECTSR